ncbi:MAG TPA: hypothetical protein VES92_12635 [Nitrospiraceae bacterium]|nr:hypothetical protein [Nitrospiraceae bacterium]
MPELTDSAERITHPEKKASATRIFQINLRKFFPPNDEYATCMARLCILREDLALEAKGISEGPFDWLDGNGIPWRHNYFFRNFAKTVREIASALQTLNCTQEFQQALKKHYTLAEQKVFRDFCKKIQQSIQLITELRNSIGGHVQHKVIGQGLKSINFDWTGFWERPMHPRDKFDHTHHPFANDLVLTSLVAGDRPGNLPVRDVTEVLAIPGEMAELLDAIPHIDALFELYVVERHLL